MSIPVYKLIHLFGLALFCYAFGGLDRGSESGEQRKRFSIAHGVGLFLTLLGGFGMAARNPAIANSDWWVICKVVVWLLLGASIVIFKRKPGLVTPMRVTLGLLMLGAAYLGLFHSTL